VKIVKGNNKTDVLTKNDKNIIGKIINIPHFAKMTWDLPNHTILFGELYCPGVKATSVPTLLNDCSDKLIITVFAAPLFATENLVNTNLDTVMKHLNHYCINTSHTILLANCETISTKFKERLLDEAVDKKWEGWVLKQAHMTGWFKLKPTKTVDAFVLSTTKSFESTYYGGLKSIHVAVYNGNKVHDLGYVGSGFDVEYRQTVNRESLIDKVAEIKYDSLAANGKLRFPRFVRWRDDKDMRQCTFDQVKES
jgi:hypothetical protein